MSKYFGNRFHYNAGGGEGGGGQTAEEVLFAKIEKRISKALENRATKDELKNIMDGKDGIFKDFPIEALRSLADDKTGAMAKLVEQGLEISRLKTSMSNQPQDMSLRAQIKNWLNSPNEEGSTKLVKDVVLEIRERKKSDLKPLELILETRDAATSPMLPSNSYGGSAYLPKPEIQSGIIDIVRPDYTFWNYIKKGATSSAVYVWVNKKNPNGAAAFIAPGVYKPGISFSIATQTSNAKKIAANEKCAVELLDDIEGMASWIEEELLYQVYQKASLTLMDSVGDDETPTGIKQLSVPFQFAALGLSTTNANMWDVIRSGVAQIRAGNHKGTITAFVNPIDYANMVMTKAQNQGQLFIPPVTGAMIVEDNNIPVGYINMGVIDNYKVKIYKSFTMSWGLENNDFTKNLRTVIGEMRIHQYFSENNAGCLLYDSIANGIAGLAPAVAPEP